MRQELQNIEYIERYLENSLSHSDKYKFEKHMQEDPGFKKAVELQRQITESLKEEAFLMDVADYHKEFLFQEKSGTSLLRYWYILPALLLIGSLAFWWTNHSKPVEELNSDVIETPITQTKPTTTEEIPQTTTAKITAKTAAFETAFVGTKIKANKGATIPLKGTNSVLHIPENAVVDKNGNPVKGSYQLEYRELKDRAQMAFSNLPMSYTNKEGQAYNFNSAGLIEVRASKNGEALQLAPGKKMTLDYEVNDRLSNLDLYQYDDDTKTWSDTKEKVKLPKKGAYSETLDSLAYLADVAKHEKKFGAYLATKPTRDGKEINVGNMAMFPEDIEQIEADERPDPNKYLVKHYDNPKLVKELRLNSFGIYNCSQLYEVQNQIAIAALYTTKQKEAIENSRMLSVIDMNYNAAYSFKPDQFICNGQANNVFLLWTNENKLYSFVKRAQVKLGTGKYSFTMEDVTPTIQNTNDLRRYLKFVEKKTKETVTKIN